MATAVLRSQDCLNHNNYFDSRPPPMTNRKKPSRSPPLKQSRQTRTKPNPSTARSKPESRSKPSLLMGHVTILKRGQDLKPDPAVDLRSNGGDLSDLCSTSRLGPDPEIVPKFSDLKPVYAGPAFVTSPAPSSLPFPAFFLKKESESESESEIKTRGLRCLLRLDPVA